MNREFREKNYFKWGLTALVVIIVAIVCYQLAENWNQVTDFASIVVSALRPIIMGLIFAYVLNPLLNIYEKFIFKKFYGMFFKKNKKMASKFSRGSAIILAVLTALAIVTGLMVLIIPELYVNINRLVTSLPTYIENGINYLTTLSEKYPEIVTPIVEYLENTTDDLLTWARTMLLPNANQFITNLSIGIYGTFMTLLDIVIGVIVAVYVLGSKEKYAAGARKYIYAMFKPENAQKVVELANYTDDRFGGFLVGKILDSAIIGVLSFIVFSIFDIPYTLLVSVIVGVTNVIPFFGPFLGAIPSGVLILLVNPAKALIFAVLILAIQQLDGNVIGPKILGDRTGLDSFMVIFAILISGGLFGIPGMIVGVPVFATVSGIVKSVCNKRLENKNLPVEVWAYGHGKVIEPECKKEDNE